MNAAVYVRVSDEDQAVQGSSIDAQQALLLRKCQEWQYNVADIYIDDGYSAKNMKRPALQKLLKDVQAGKVQVIVFWRLDRLTRRNRDFHKITELLEQHRAGIRSATENIDTTTAMGRFQLELTISLGQLERETTAERVHFVMQERHLKGKRNGAVAPYGYDLSEGKLIINPEQADVVRRIFDLYLQNKSVRYIAKLFNSEGVDKGGSVWADHSVYYILTNPVYTGKLRWNYRKQAGRKTGKEIITDSEHEAIISEEAFNKVQEMREMRRKEGKKATSDFPFSGTLRCGRCGYGMIGTSRQTSTGRRRAYKCIGRFNYGICDLPMIADESVTEAFLEALEPSSNMMQKLASYLSMPKPETGHDEKKKLESELDAIQKRKKKWQLAYANDVISLEDLQERTQEDKAREETIKQKLAAMKETTANPMTMEDYVKRFADLKNIWLKVKDDSVKKQFIQNMFDSILIDTNATDIKGGPGRRVPVFIKDWSLSDD